MERQRKQGGESDNGGRVAQAKFTSKSRESEQEQQLANSPAMVAQRRTLQRLFGDAIQRKEEDDDKMRQAKFDSAFPLQRKEEPAAKPNNTGLPDNLKHGIESLSGMSMDSVRVHYNSSQPAQLNALAYAQGTDIHVAPGQEQHLPHEAWHVVQQAQGRVKPTMQMMDSVPVNDDKGLEHEADVMGGMAMQLMSNKRHDVYLTTALKRGCSQTVTQRVTTVTSTKQELPYPNGVGGINQQLAGNVMNAYLDPLDPIAGSEPGGGGAYALYPQLNAIHAASFVKGHLLNANLGGPGLPINLFPITAEANKAHSAQVEEPVKSNFLALARKKGAIPGFAFVPTTADRLHYQVTATWNQPVTNDFLNNPTSQLDCFAEFVDTNNASVGPLVGPVTIHSNPAGAPATPMNDQLGNIGWGSLGSGARTNPNKFTTQVVAYNPLGAASQWTITGPQWDNANQYIGQKVHITFA